MEQNIIPRLFAFDYDGTLVAPGEAAWESLRHAAREVAPSDFPREQLNTLIEELLVRTTGTTELRLALELVNSYGISDAERDHFVRKFYDIRKRYLEDHGLVNGIELENAIVGRDIIFEQALLLLHKIQSQNRFPEEHREFENECWLVTGNPRDVMQMRLPIELKPFFTSSTGELRMICGDQGIRREALIKMAIGESGFSSKMLFEWDYDAGLVSRHLGTHYEYPCNVFYFGDTEEDVRAALTLGVRSICINPNERVRNELKRRIMKDGHYASFEIPAYTAPPIATVLDNINHPILVNNLRLPLRPYYWDELQENGIGPEGVGDYIVNIEQRRRANEICSEIRHVSKAAWRGGNFNDPDCRFDRYLAKGDITSVSYYIDPETQRLRWRLEKDGEEISLESLSFDERIR